MGLKADLEAEVRDIFRYEWEKRKGEVVPEPESLALNSNDAVELTDLCVEG